MSVMPMLAVAIAIGLMMLGGIQKNALEIKRKRRVCPSCGHQIRGRVCDRH